MGVDIGGRGMGERGVDCGCAADGVGFRVGLWLWLESGCRGGDVDVVESCHFVGDDSMKLEAEN